MPVAEARQRFCGKYRCSFLTSGYRSVTCPEKVQDIEMLSDAVNGVARKMESLIGSSIPREAFEKKDYQIPLDFSKSPKFSTILVSYLVYRSDFYGRLLNRALEYHAQRGAQVKILVADVIQLDKDNEMLFDLIAKNPNIKLTNFRWNSPLGAGLRSRLSELHKTNHVKLLIGLSDETPEKSFMVIGGRNIHDGFLFLEKPDYSNDPTLVQYGEGKDENFIHWQDFEILVKGHEFAKTTAKHFMTYWDQDE